MFYDFIQLLANRKKCRAVLTAGCLLTAFIFTGCGGGGSSSGNTDETIASAAKSFTAEFPTFDDGGKNVIYAKTSIYYPYYSKDYAKAINATLTEVKNFDSNCFDSSHCQYSPKYSPASKDLIDISSTAYFDLLDGDNLEFDFVLEAERKISYSEFDDIFGSFTRFDDIIVLLKYDTNMSAEFDAYRDKLIDSGLFTAADCDGWHCSKNDGFVYHSVTAGDFNGDTEAILFEKYLLNNL
ncbi:MAG: hypothetical protein LBG21_00285 [Campylobacteraceae bacterium]|jgi:hypothetical protein|nr:hypothetical protein [Campylobacteraceae bacterium]